MTTTYCETCGKTTNDRDPGDVCHCEKCEGCDQGYDARYGRDCLDCAGKAWGETPNGRAEWEER